MLKMFGNQTVSCRIERFAWWRQIIAIVSIQVFLGADYFLIRVSPPWPDELTVLFCAMATALVASWLVFGLLPGSLLGFGRASWLVAVGCVVLGTTYAYLSARFILHLPDRFHREAISWKYTEAAELIREKRPTSDLELVEDAGRQVEDVFEPNSLAIVRSTLFMVWLTLVGLVSVFPLVSFRHDVRRHPRREWVIGDYVNLAALVDRDAVELDPILAAITQALGRGIGETLGRNFATGIRDVAAAAYDALRVSTHLKYDFEPANPGKDGLQEIRLTRGLLANGSATCLDLALLFASVLEKAHVAALVVFLKKNKDGQQHAIAGFFDERHPPTDPVVITDSELIHSWLGKGSVILIETTGLSTNEGRKLSYTQACQEGTALLKTATVVAVVNVIAARKAGIGPPE